MGKEQKNKKKAEEERITASLDKLRLLMKLFTSNVLMQKEEEEDTEEYSEEDYNVCVYQILPYPPNTKDHKEFFIQRT